MTFRIPTDILCGACKLLDEVPESAPIWRVNSSDQLLWGWSLRRGAKEAKSRAWAGLDSDGARAAALETREKGVVLFGAVS